MDIATIFKRSVERNAKRTALVYGERRWTYADWYRRTSRFAQALADLGVRPGDRVAFYINTSEPSVTTYFACQLLRAVAVPMNFRLSAGEVAYILRDSGARILVYGGNLMDNAVKVQQQVNSVHDYVCCERAAERAIPDGHHDFEVLAEETEERGDPRPIPEPHHLSALVYTSGTTGRPKGVMHTHGNDVAIAMNCVMEYQLGARDVALHIAPLYHVGGMQAFYLPHMMVGGTNVVLGRYEAEKTMATIAAERVTTLFAVPTQIQEMLFHPRFKEYDTSTLRVTTTGGAAISKATMERALAEFCPRIYNGYGMTEASLTLLLHPEDAIERLGSCGKPTLITSARIISNEPGREPGPSETLPPHEIGQLIVHGPQVMSGYFNNPFETSKKLKGGWLFTGDLMSRDEEGFFYFHGRADDMIVSGGENIYPREVEEVLYKCPGVQEAAVIGLPDEKWGQIVAAYLVASDRSLTAETVDAYCKSSDDLAPYKRPKKYTFVDALPTNPSGKVLKRELLAAATSAA